MQLIDKAATQPQCAGAATMDFKAVSGIQRAGGVIVFGDKKFDLQDGPFAAVFGDERQHGRADAQTLILGVHNKARDPPAMRCTRAGFGVECGAGDQPGLVKRPNDKRSFDTVPKRQVTLTNGIGIVGAKKLWVTFQRIQTQCPECGSIVGL